MRGSGACVCDSRGDALGLDRDALKHLARAVVRCSERVGEAKPPLPAVLASLAELPAAAQTILEAFSPKVVVMLLRSKDTIVQAASARLSRRIADESLVLLANRGRTLPLRRGQRIAGHPNRVKHPRYQRNFMMILKQY